MRTENRLRIFLIFLLVLLAGTSIYLWIRLEQKTTELRQAETTLLFLMEYSRGKEELLHQAEEQLASSQQENQSLTNQLEELELEKEAMIARAELYRAQKFYFLDALDWLSSFTGYVDPEHVVRSYANASGEKAPESCEVTDYQRYQHWISTRSVIYIASPEKMGWSRFTNWSIRENVVFGPEHSSLLGYVGSRGYEFRYPLVAGTFPQQELHTTIDVYDHLISGEGLPQSDAERIVDLLCNLKGYIVVSSDPDETKTIYFAVGNFQANVKLKYYFDDYEGAVAHLTQAANVVIRDLVAGY